LGLPEHLSAQPRIGGQGVLELPERLGRPQLNVDRLEAIAPVVRRLQDGRVRPDLRFGRAASRREYPDDRPGIAAYLELVANLQAGEFPGRANPHDDLVLSPF